MDTAKAGGERPKKPRSGRPWKASREGRRYQIGVIVTGATKADITEAAKKSGRTISREVEHMIERCRQYERMFKAMGRTLEEIQRGNVHAAMYRSGWMPRREMINDKIWLSYCEPGHPHANEIDPGTGSTSEPGEPR
jgi:hypothetical protein